VNAAGSGDEASLDEECQGIGVGVRLDKVAFQNLISIHVL